MSVQVIDNFSYKGKKGNFERDNFDTLQAMRSYPEDGIDDGHVCFCNEDGNHYKFNHLNSVDGATGRWRLHNKSVNTLTETGEGKVLDARQGKILKDLIDAKVIEAGGVSFDTIPTKDSTNPVTSNGIREAMDEQAESINSNMGVNDYPVFSASEAYSKGKVVNYNGKLYKFTADHAAGAWIGTDVEETDVVKAHIVQETGDSETAVMSQKAVTEKLNAINDKFGNQISEIEAAKDAALNEIEDTEQEAILNFNAQRVTPEMLSEGVKQLIETAGGGTINNLPDEEDITSTGSDMPVLKFKDKAYNQEIFSGKGRVYLRKNIIDGKNILTQSMLNAANSEYIIQYDYDLNGASITVPEGCVLKFEGG